MRLKRLVTYTLAAATLLCTASCIKDEAANAEADIISVTLPEDILTGTEIEYDLSYDETLGAYPINIEVYDGTDLTALAPEFELTPGATIEPESGSTHDFTNAVYYTVTSEDRNWQRRYAINIGYPETTEIPTTYNFETVRTVSYSTSNYYVFYEAAEGCSTLTWGSGNQGFALTGTYTADGFPTTISADGRTGNCLQLITRSTGSLGTMVNMPIASGNLFIGTFNIGNALTDALAATRFGTTFRHKPTKLTGYYKYTAGDSFYDGGSYTDQEDMFNIYALFYETSDDLQTLDGYIVKNDYEDDSMVAVAVIDNPKETDEWTYFELDFDYDRYGKTVDAAKLANGQYNISIVLASSKNGDEFKGAVGSTLLVDDMKLEYED